LGGQTDPGSGPPDTQPGRPSRTLPTCFEPGPGRGMVHIKAGFGVTAPPYAPAGSEAVRDVSGKGTRCLSQRPGVGVESLHCRAPTPRATTCNKCNECNDSPRQPPQPLAPLADRHCTPGAPAHCRSYPPPCNDSPPVQQCNEITGSRLQPVRPFSVCVAGPLPLLGEGAQRACSQPARHSPP